MANPLYRVTEEVIDMSVLLAAVGAPGAGGTTLFVGTTRDENDGRVVERLEYEAYEAMAVQEMRRIGDDIAQRWDVVAVAMVHRVGVVPVGEASVAIAGGTAGFAAASGRGSSRTILCAPSRGESAWNGCWPAQSSYNFTPNAKTSQAGVAASHLHCSGDM